MLCENCGEREAAIHLTQIVETEMTTHHLCEICAAEQGLDAADSPAAAPLADFLAQMGKGGPRASAAGTCPACGLSLADFKGTGRLGCARCWSVFDPSLRGLLRKLHGSTQHTGKVHAGTAGGRSARPARVVALRRRLLRAVEEEDFELAAELRDEIRRLEED